MNQMTPWEREMMFINANSDEDREKLRQIMDSNIEQELKDKIAEMKNKQKEISESAIKDQQPSGKRGSKRDKKVDKNVAEWKDKLQMAAGGSVDFDNMGKPEMTPDEID